MCTLGGSRTPGYVFVGISENLHQIEKSFVLYDYYSSSDVVVQMTSRSNKKNQDEILNMLKYVNYFHHE